MYFFVILPTESAFRIGHILGFHEKNKMAMAYVFRLVLNQIFCALSFQKVLKFIWKYFWILCVTHIWWQGRNSLSFKPVVVFFKILDFLNNDWNFVTLSAKPDGGNFHSVVHVLATLAPTPLGILVVQKMQKSTCAWDDAEQYMMMYVNTHTHTRARMHLPGLVWSENWLILFGGFSGLENTHSTPHNASLGNGKLFLTLESCFMRARPAFCDCVWIIADNERERVKDYFWNIRGSAFCPNDMCSIHTHTLLGKTIPIVWMLLVSCCLLISSKILVQGFSIVCCTVWT